MRKSQLAVNYAHDRFIGWLKNFISDRNNATNNLIDSYVAVTFTRRAPSDLRAVILTRWNESVLRTPARSFLLSVSEIMARSRGMTGLRNVVVNLAPHNTRQHNDPSPELQALFNVVEPHLTIRIMGRAALRKNGRRIVTDAYISYFRDGAERIGVVSQVFVGVHVLAPYEHVASVCSMREVHASRVSVIKSRDSGRRLLVVTKVGTVVLVNTESLRWLYHRAIWDLDVDDYFALVRFERL